MAVEYAPATHSVHTADAEAPVKNRFIFSSEQESKGKVIQFK